MVFRVGSTRSKVLSSVLLLLSLPSQLPLAAWKVRASAPPLSRRFSSCHSLQPTNAQILIKYSMSPQRPPRWTRGVINHMIPATATASFSRVVVMLSSRIFPSADMLS